MYHCGKQIEYLEKILLSFKLRHVSKGKEFTTFSIPILNGPTSGTAVTLKTGRREVPGSNPGRACRPSRSEFSVVFSETRVNTG